MMTPVFAPYRRHTLWLLVVLIAACFSTAPTVAVAASSNETLDPCNADVPYYTAAQTTDTRTFLQAFADQIFPLHLTWTGCTNFCTWEYLTCTEAGVELNFVNAEVIGDLAAVPPTVTGANVMVTKVDLTDNTDVSGQLPPSWSTLSRLTSISIRGTTIGGLLQPAWAALSNLEYIDCSETQITATVPSEWQALKKLRVLRAYGLDVEGTLPASWSALTALTELDIHSCAFTGTLPASWASLPQLATLRVNANRLSGSVPEAYGAMRSIATVALEGNSLCGCLPAAWTAATATVEVSADANVTAGNCATANSCFPVPSSSSSSSYFDPSSLPSPLPVPPPSSSSSSSNACSADVPYFTEAEVEATQCVLFALRDGMPALTAAWQCSNYCTWSGVQCSTSGLTVSLSGTNLIGTLAEVPAVANLNDVVLTAIDLSENPQLTGTLPLGWLQLPRLTSLDVSGCSIGGTLPEF